MTLLVKNADVLVTMDDRRREIPRGGLFVRDGFIEQVGPSDELPETADEILDLSGHVVLPGLVNTHHHLFQTLTRATPVAQNNNLFDWLQNHYPIWTHLTPEALRIATMVGTAELLLSGCTTVFDHSYLFPNGCRLDDQIAAAAEVGVRFHASRGSMTLGKSRGGMPPDGVVEDEAFVLKDCRRLLEQYHDPKPGALVRVALAPCAPFSVTADLLRETLQLARAYGVGLHTHLGETLDEQRYTLARFGLRPLEYMESLGWVGPDVWFAHSVHINDAEVGRYAATGCGVAHCPSSNMRLASGIAPVKKYLAAGVKVGLGVDGSASNDSSHMLAEVRQAMLLARLGLAFPPSTEEPGSVSRAPTANEWMTAREALEVATRGGAAVLGRDDVGVLAPGKCADFFAVDLNRIDFAGNHDPVAAVVFCAPQKANYTAVHGRLVVQEGRLTTVDERSLTAKHNLLARALFNSR